MSKKITIQDVRRANDNLIKLCGKERIQRDWVIGNIIIPASVIKLASKKTISNIDRHIIQDRITIQDVRRANKELIRKNKLRQNERGWVVGNTIIPASKIKEVLRKVKLRL